MFEERATRIALYGSVLLHLLFLLMYEGVHRLRPFSVSASPSYEAAPEEQEKRIEFELVETPENARTEAPSEDTHLLSDKTAAAREEIAPEEELPVGLPYAEGDLALKNLIQPAPGSNETPIPEEAMEDHTDDDASPEETQTTTFVEQVEAHRDFLANIRRDLQSARSDAPPGLLGPDRQAQFDNRTSSTRNIGGLSFDTYNWHFAPYMLEMKRRVESNMFPPPAFRLGLLGSAETIIRFRIARTGRVESLELISHDGHKWLESTSTDAIKLSAPFPPLPADFPKEYLEVTGKFLYVLTR